MGWSIHLHLLAAISWIGGSIFMFVLGITLRNKSDQVEVYPRIGPIFGYFELVSLFLLIVTGIIMISQNGLLDILFSQYNSELIETLRKKLVLVLLVIIFTIIHFVIAIKTNDIPRTKIQQLFSRGSSLLIFFLNLWILHYAIIIRNTL
ncbi:MAG: hypothetical protein ACXW1A_06445 [Nitrososphaeraceae archaeon]